MNDIAERLRESAKHSRLCGWSTHALLDEQAADEIERLGKDSDRWRIESANVHVRNMELVDEIERLRSLVEKQSRQLERLLLRKDGDAQ